MLYATGRNSENHSVLGIKIQAIFMRIPRDLFRAGVSAQRHNQFFNCEWGTTERNDLSLFYDKITQKSR